MRLKNYIRLPCRAQMHGAGSVNPYMLGAVPEPAAAAQEALHTSGLMPRMPRFFRGADPGKQKMNDMNTILRGVEVQVSMSHSVWFTGVVMEVHPGHSRYSTTAPEYDAPRALVHVKSYFKRAWCDKSGEFVESEPLDISGFFTPLIWDSIISDDEEKGTRCLKSFDLIRTERARSSGFGLVELPSSFACETTLRGCKFQDARPRRHRNCAGPLSGLAGSGQRAV